MPTTIEIGTESARRLRERLADAGRGGGAMVLSGATSGRRPQRSGGRMSLVGEELSASAAEGVP